MTAGKTAAISLGIIAFLVFVIVNIQRSVDKKSVLSDHSFTSGRITVYTRIGVHLNRSLTYEYTVNGKQYTRTIAPEVSFPMCETDISACLNKRFFVAYYNKNPGKSLIDLQDEVEAFERDQRPKSLRNFE
jgi:hypothetical protein